MLLNKIIILFTLLPLYLGANIIEIYEYPHNTAFNIINISEDRGLNTEKHIMFYDKYRRYSIENFIKKIRFLDNRINLLLIGSNRTDLINLSNKLSSESKKGNIFIFQY